MIHDIIIKDAYVETTRNVFKGLSRFEVFPIGNFSIRKIIKI